MNKFLITGGAGFIGSHLAEYILKKGGFVVVVDNLSTGRKDNITPFLSNPKFRFVKGDIRDVKVMGQLVKDCDTIYHLAAAVGVKLIVQNPLESLLVNIKGTEVVLELAAKHGKKVIIASSSEVYGKNFNTPLKETDDRILGNTHITRWNYSCSKAADEFLALAYHKEKNLKVVIFRFFNMVGPKQTGMYGMVIPTFIKQALENKPITVYGDGKQSRTFCFVNDAVEIIYEISKNTKAVGQIFNIGSSEEITILNLAEKIKSMTKSKSEVVLVPYEKAYGVDFEDTLRRAPNIEKLKKVTGLWPKTKLDDTLKSIISYFKEGNV